MGHLYLMNLAAPLRSRGEENVEDFFRPLAPFCSGSLPLLAAASAFVNLPATRYADNLIPEY